MTRKSGNYQIKITRLNPDGSRDYVNMLECDRIESAKRQAAQWSREPGLYATIYDTFNGGAAIYQYTQGHKVAEVTQ
jgi:hypothetical protein